MVPFLPASIIKASRHETPEPLQLKIDCPDQSEPLLPAGLHGHIFIVAPLPPRTSAQPFQLGERSAVNGDGIVYRISFQAGRATLKTAIAKTPCYYADLASQLLKDYRDWEFRDGGVARLSLILGNRNQLNTAFLKTNRRLFITYDAGRPYSIDPETLELVEPLGNTAEWRPLLALPIQQIFEPYSSSAHPVCTISSSGQDSSAEEVFIVNYSSGYNGRFHVPANRLFNWFSDQINQAAKRAESLFSPQTAANHTAIWGAFTDLLRCRPQAADHSKPEYGLERWQLQLADGSPVVIEQSVHQMAITQDYIILGDLAFGLEYSQIFSPYFLGFLWSPRFQEAWYSNFLGKWLYSVFLQLKQVQPFTNFYVIRRADLDQRPDPVSESQPEQPRRLTALKLAIPRAVSHFAVDYQNLDDQLTFHVGHHNGLDPTEWINEYDQPVNPEAKGCLRTDLRGVLVGTTDLGSFGRYVFDAKTGTLLNSKSVAAPGNSPDLPPLANSWVPAVYSHADLNPAQEQVQKIYWISWGFSWEVLPQRIYDAYRFREYREVPLVSLPNTDLPPTLLCLDTVQMQIVDAYALPPGHALFSPQFIPDSDSTQPGFVACVVLADDSKDPNRPGDQIWIFQADCLKQGPICKLHYPDLNLGLTLHSTWLSEQEFERCCYPSASERRERRSRSFKVDYAARIQQNTWSNLLQQGRMAEFFNKYVVEHFMQQKAEQEVLRSISKGR